MGDVGINNNKLIVKEDSLVLPTCATDPPIPVNRQIWSNMTMEEIKICLPSGVRTVPHSGFDRCLLKKIGNQTIPVGSEWVDITWDAEEYDTSPSGMHSNTVNKHRTNGIKTGEYSFIYKVKMQSSDKFETSVRMLKNNFELYDMGYIRAGSKDAGQVILFNTTPLIHLNSGDYVSLQVVHDDQFAKDIISSDSFFYCERRY